MTTTTKISRRRLDALDEVDRMPPALRQCVHEFGLPIVSVLVKHGITDPRHVREIVGECWKGGRQAGQRNGVAGTLDALLASGPVSGAALRRVLAENSMVIAPVTPTRPMLDASMDAVTGHKFRITREEKHRRRIRAALGVLRPN